MPGPDNRPDALNELRSLLNVTDETWSLIAGWLVAAYIPDIPHPILMLGGLQGAGKSTAAKLLINLVDPSPVPLRAAPRNLEQWGVSASASWCVGIDNVSYISQWWSDAMCRAVTGEGVIARKLYTNDEQSLLQFRRCIVLTSIDAGALRGDLGERLILIDLESISDANRLTENEILDQYAKVLPQIFAGLLSAVSQTLAVMPDVKLTEMPRMADFAKVLCALDDACPALTGGVALQMYLGQRDRIAQDVIDSDPVASAIVGLMDKGGWSGTSSDLVEVLESKFDGRLPKGWPNGPRQMTSMLQRVIPALKRRGIEVEGPNRRSWSINRE